MSIRSATEPPARPQMRLLDWHPLRKSSLRGFATIELPIGLRIVDCPVLVSGGTTWATLPGKPRLDETGRQRRDDSGKPLYSNLLDWRTRELREGFSDRVVALVRQAHPDDLASGDAREPTA